MSGERAAMNTDNHRARVLKLLQKKRGVLKNQEWPGIEISLSDTHKPFPMTPLQVLYAEDSYGKSHMYLELGVASRLDMVRLTRALNTLIERHPMLRASVLPNGQFRINESLPDTYIKMVDFSLLDSGQASRKIDDVRRTMIDRGPSGYPDVLFDMTVCAFGQTSFKLCFVINLLIDDGLSNTLLIRELETLYFHPDRVLEPIDLTYRDYVFALDRYKKTERYRHGEAYWMKRLPGFPLPVSFPYLLSYREGRNPSFVRFSVTVDSNRWALVQTRARHQGTTDSSVLVAACSKALSLLADQKYFSFFIMNSNRLPLHPQVNNLFGNFSSTLLFEVDLREDTGMDACVKNSQKRLLQDLEHGAFTGVDVLHLLSVMHADRIPTRMPVVFSSNLFATDVFETGDDRNSGETVRVIGNSLQRSLVDMDIQVNSEKGGLTLNCDCIAGKYETEMLQAFLDTFKDNLHTYAAREPEVSGYEDNHSTLFTFRAHGNKTPVFCVHPVGGGVIGFKCLADLVDTNHPFYAFQARGLYGGGKPVASIQEMAELYLRSLIQVWPRGPVLLSGYSFGGLVAFEMARQLTDMGRDVLDVMVLDGAAPVCSEEWIDENRDQLFSMDDGKWLIMVAHLMEKSMKIKLNMTLEELSVLTPEQQECTLIDAFIESSGFIRNSGYEMVRNMLYVNKANYQAMLSYFPTPASFPVTVFKSEEKVGNDSILTFYKNYYDPALGWGAYSTQPVTVLPVPGDHYSMMAPPHVNILADTLNDHIRKYIN